MKELVGEEKTLAGIVADRDKALAEAHRKYVEATEAARKEYVEAKRRIYPELFRPSPEEQEKIIQGLEARVRELEGRPTEGST